MFEVLKYAARNDERTTASKEGAVAAAEKARSIAVGQAILKGETFEAAKVAGDAAYVAIVPHSVTWFEVDPDKMYPAAIAYLKEALPRLVSLANLEDRQLAAEALGGNAEAAYILLSAGKQMVREIQAAVAAAGSQAWSLAMEAYEEFDLDDEGQIVLLKQRFAVLEAVRRFFTEALHQTVGNSKMGLHMSKSERFKLGNLEDK